MLSLPFVLLCISLSQWFSNCGVQGPHWWGVDDRGGKTWRENEMIFYQKTQLRWFFLLLTNAKNWRVWTFFWLMNLGIQEWVCETLQKHFHLLCLISFIRYSEEFAYNSIYYKMLNAQKCLLGKNINTTLNYICQLLSLESLEYKRCQKLDPH